MERAAALIAEARAGFLRQREAGDDAAPEPTSYFEHGGWALAARKTRISAADDIDRWADELGLAIPEIMFGENALALAHAESGLCLFFDAREALRGCRFDQGASAARVQCADAWAEVRGDIQPLQVEYDWTYATAHAGSLGRLRDLDAAGVAPSARAAADVAALEGEGEIDYELLQRRDPILWGHAVDLYEDELHDNGVANLTVKIRVMPACLFVLQRYWLRLDRVMLRVVDTRFFHRVGADHCVRECTRREVTFAELERQGRSTAIADYGDPNEFLDAVPVVSQTVCRIPLSVGQSVGAGGAAADLPEPPVGD